MVESGDKPLVTITGVTGFLGAATALAFIQDGSYKVRGTVRSLANEDKLRPLKNVLGDLFEQIELVEADLMDKDSLIKSIEGSTFVAHTASPLVMGGTEEEVVTPAINGTVAVMEGCLKAGVKRCVLTSSTAAVMSVDPKNKPPNGVWDQTYWSDENRPGGLGTYLKSKTLAERAAWKFVEDLPADQKFELCTINPTIMWGPSGQEKAEGTNNMFLGHLEGRRAELPQSSHGIVDVRDCADAQVKALQVPEAAGNRFILFAGSFKAIEISKVLHDEFASQGWPVVLKESDTPPTDPPSVCDTSPARDILGIKFRSLKETLIDTANSFISRGVAKKPE